MKQYHDLCQHILDKGVVKADRTGTGTISSFGHQMRFDLNEGFPLLTTKRTHMKSIAHELIWFIRGDSDISYLKENDVTIWDEWAKEDGWVGPIYGVQWRRWSHQKEDSFELIDQLANVIERIKTKPDDRRLIVSAWNVGEIPEMALPPCHSFFQFYVSNGKLSCQMYQRSADMFLGVPFNIASYALLTHMVAQVTGLGVGEFIHTLGDAHIYLNHVDQTKLMLTRDERPLPKLILDPSIMNIDHFKYEHIKIEGYNPHPAIKGPVSI